MEDRVARIVELGMGIDPALARAVLENVSDDVSSPHRAHLPVCPPMSTLAMLSPPHHAQSPNTIRFRRWNVPLTGFSNIQVQGQFLPAFPPPSLSPTFLNLIHPPTLALIFTSPFSCSGEMPPPRHRPPPVVRPDRAPPRHVPSARMQQLLESQLPGNAYLRHELYERCMGKGTQGKQQDVGDCESWVGLFKIALLFIASFVVQPYCLSGASYC
jgi:hypothetical protein